MAAKSFPIILETEEDLHLQHNIYKDLCTANATRMSDVKRELNQLEVAAAHFDRILTQIDAYISAPASIHQPIAKSRPEAAPYTLFAEDTGKRPLNERINVADAVYEPEMTRAQKAEYALKVLGEPATTREILTLLTEADPGMLEREKITFDKYQKALAATLIQKATAKLIFYSTKNSIGVKYGLIEWL